MAKMYASDIALEVTNDALQIHGGSGFLKGMEVERAYRDAKITTIYEGTNEIQRLRSVRKRCCAKVCVVPGSAFLTDGEPCQSFRINYSTPDPTSSWSKGMNS